MTYIIPRNIALAQVEGNNLNLQNKRSTEGNESVIKAASGDTFVSFLQQQAQNTPSDEQVVTCTRVFLPGKPTKPFNADLLPYQSGVSGLGLRGLYYERCRQSERFEIAR